MRGSMRDASLSYSGATRLLSPTRVGCSFVRICRRPKFAKMQRARRRLGAVAPQSLLAMPVSEHTAPERQARFRRGVAQFNAGHFFDAHETWEEIWLQSLEPEKT